LPSLPNANPFVDVDRFLKKMGERDKPPADPVDRFVAEMEGREKRVSPFAEEPRAFQFAPLERAGYTAGTGLTEDWATPTPVRPEVPAESSFAPPYTPSRPPELWQEPFEKPARTPLEVFAESPFGQTVHDTVEEARRAVLTGLYSTTPGLALQLATGEPYEPAKMGTAERAISGALSLLADPVTYVSGGASKLAMTPVMGSIMRRGADTAARRFGTKTVGRAGMVGGTLGGLAATHDPLQQLIHTGRWDPVQTGVETLKATATGAAAGAAGAVPFVGLPAEIGAFGTLDALFQGRAPSTEDYVDAAATILTLRAVHSLLPAALNKEARGKRLTPKENEALDSLTQEERIQIEIEARRPHVGFEVSGKEPGIDVVRFKEPVSKKVADRIFDMLRADYTAHLRQELPAGKVAAYDYDAKTGVMTLPKELSGVFGVRDAINAATEMRRAERTQARQAQVAVPQIGGRVAVRFPEPRIEAETRRPTPAKPAAEVIEGTRKYSSDSFVEETLTEMEKAIPPGDTKRRAAFDLLVQEYQHPERGLPAPDIAALAREGDARARLALQMAQHAGLLYRPLSLSEIGVERQYPGVAKFAAEVEPSELPVEGKQPWQMTAYAFDQAQFKKAPKIAQQNWSEGGAWASDAAHRESVKNAIHAGKSVPAEVLKDYPDLAAGAMAATLEPLRPSWEIPFAERLREQGFSENEIHNKIKKQAEWREEQKADELADYDYPESPLTPMSPFLPPEPPVTTGPSPRVPPAPISGKPAKKTWDIIFNVHKAFGKRPTVGKMPRRAKGYYDPQTGAVVIRYAGDADATAHEIGHALDDAVGLLQPWHKPRVRSPYDAELIPDFSQYGSVTKSGPKSTLRFQRGEGLAEWVRAYIVNPKEAVSRAPQFSQYVFEKIGKRAKGELDRFSREVREHAGSGALAKIQSNVLTESDYPALQNVKQTMRQLWQPKNPEEVAWTDQVKDVVHNDLSFLYRQYDLVRGLRGLEDPLPSKDLRTLVNAVSGFRKKAYTWWTDGPYTFDLKDVLDVGNERWLFEPLDKSSVRALHEEKHLAVGYAIAERHLEKSAQFSKAAEAIVQVEPELKALKREHAQTLDPELRKEMQQQIRLLTELLSNARRTLGYKGKARGAVAYANAKNQRMIGAGMGLESDLDVSQRAIEELGADPERLARVKEAARRYRAMANAGLKYAVDAELISPAEYERIRANNQQYVALNRLFEQLEPDYARTVQKYGGGRRIFHRFWGSTRPIQDPYVSLHLNIDTIIKQADINAARRAFTDLLDTERGMHAERFVDLNKIGRKARKGEPHTIPTYKEGKRQYHQLNPHLYEALNRVGKGYSDRPMVWNVLTALARLTKTSVTHFPAFFIRQHGREPIFRTIVSDVDSKPWSQFYWAFNSDRKFAHDLKRFYRTGAGLFGWFGVSERDYYLRLRDVLKDVATEGKAVVTTPHRAWQAYSEFASMGEVASRVVEFTKAERYAKEKLGYGDLDAQLYGMRKARQIQDFAVAGRFMRELNEIIPFANPGYRGIARSFEALVQHPVRTPLRILLYAGIPKMMEVLWNAWRDDLEELREKPSWQRDMFLNFKLGPDFWLTLPMPWELGVMGSLFGRGLDWGLGQAGVLPQNKHPLEGWGESFITSASPFELGDFFFAMQPFMEAMVGKDFFRDRYVVPPWEDDLDLELRDNVDKSSRIGQLLQRLLRVDARKIDHVFSGMLGTAGRVGLALTDVGREEREAGRRVGMMTTGLLRPGAVYSSRDVQWCMEYAKRKGLSQHRYLRGLGQRLNAYSQATTAEARERAGKHVRDYAKWLREILPKLAKPREFKLKMKRESRGNPFALFKEAG
jgi:hypothetical protein